MNKRPLQNEGDSKHDTPIGRLFTKWHTEKARIDAANDMSNEDGVKAVEFINGYVRKALGELPITPTDFWRLAIMSFDQAGCLDGTFEEQFLARAHAEIKGSATKKSKSDVKPLGECQHDAVTLSSLLNGLDLLYGEGIEYESARAAMAIIAAERADDLAQDLDRLETALRAN